MKLPAITSSPYLFLLPIASMAILFVLASRGLYDMSNDTFFFLLFFFLPIASLTSLLTLALRFGWLDILLLSTEASHRAYTHRILLLFFSYHGGYSFIPSRTKRHLRIHFLNLHFLCPIIYHPSTLSSLFIFHFFFFLLSPLLTQQFL